MLRIMLCLALVSHSGSLSCDGGSVTEVVVLDEVQVVVELEDIRCCCRDVQARDVLVADALEVLDDTAEAVTVSVRSMLSFS